MASKLPSDLTQNITESENLLSGSCHEDELMYHEMEMSEGLRVQTKDSQRCLSLSGSTKYIIAAIVASLGGVLFGYDLGIVSGAILQLKREFNLDCQQQEMVVSSMLFGALLGSLVGGYIIDYLGRRKTIIINAFVFFAGALTLAFAPSYTLLIIGRLIVGFATSLSAISECIYIAEISPSKQRGLLVSLNEIGIVSGLLLAYFVNYIFISTDNGWRYMFGLSGIPALLQGYGIIFLPPSPRWLICQGQDAKALKVMRSLNHGGEPEEEISKIKDSLDLEHNFNICYLFSRHQNMRDRMFVGLGVAFFQQFTGQPSVLYYAPSIFENIGFQSHSAATLATVGIGITKLVATIVTLFLVDKVGRRRFLLCGAILMTISISVLYIVTQCFPGGYHKELCQNTQNTPQELKQMNLSLMASFSHIHGEHKISCTPMLTYIAVTNTPHIKLKGSSYKYVRPSSTTFISMSTTNDHYQIEKRLLCPTPSVNTNGTIPDNKSKPASTNDNEIPTAVKYVTVLSLMAFAGAYSCGYGPISWLVLSEIFPTEIKGRAFAATTVLNWSSNLVVSLSMLDLIDSIGVSWTFFIYGAIGVLAVIFIYKFIPETKNRSLEEINALFSTRSLTSIQVCLELMRPGLTSMEVRLVKMNLMRNSYLENCKCFGMSSCCPAHYSSISTSTAQDTGLLEGDEWQL